MEESLCENKYKLMKYNLLTYILRIPPETTVPGGYLVGHHLINIFKAIF